MSYDGTDQIPEFGDRPQIPGPTPQGRLDQPTTATRQLVRDPYTRLGGVASGLANYFGVDVSIVRLGFVLFTLFSGVGLVVYLLAWLVVPRAEYWPPVGTARPLRTITAREVGIGLAILGGLLFLFFNGGGTARVLVPILLVAGGVWLLRQPEAASTPGGSITVPPPPPYPSSALSYPAPDERTRAFESTDPTTVGHPFSSASAPQPADTMTPPPPLPPPPAPSSTTGPAPGTPVPPRRRRWRRVVIPLLVLFVLLPLLLIALALGLLIGNGVDFDGGFDARYQPATVDAIPSTIEQDAGEVVLDLTDVDFDALLAPAPDAPPPPDAVTGPGMGISPDVATVPEVPAVPELPIPVAIDMSFGEIRVIVPDDLAVDVDAEADFGDVRVFGDFQDGIRNEVTVDVDDPVLDLEIRLVAGAVVVERG